MEATKELMFGEENSLAGDLRLDEASESREAFEGYVLKWRRVSTKKFFGDLGYFVGRKLFAFFSGDELVLTKLSAGNKRSLYRELRGDVSEWPDKRKKGWVKVRVTEMNLKHILVYASISYNRAEGEA